ncbi:class I SAM-dependent methyltransferase [Streptomyces sp. TLI_171]|uniref:class I SAM-dependent methyltransferase n=1 Tax=Streptomyces sp. TLI_171 TaxID=1938859 RepID=UPI000C19FF03|nr:class I SAM-dependent methyltransferase [Streptomyces sp. TLI_171]RKE17624.1 ubiquinone/menaquinone biosynthesis C-methylase UbiE [Streptomyces sp. TLI_171]
MTAGGEVGQAYDAVAELYATLFKGELAAREDELALIRQLVAAPAVAGRGLPVGDLGCGPGEATALLSGLGVRAFGLDLSAGMLAQARRAFPAEGFVRGSLLALPLADRSLGAVLARYSLIHLPPGRLPHALAELRRVLAPGGLLLTGFFAADRAVGEPVAFDHKVATARRWPVDTFAALLHDAGFTETARTVRDPAPGERFPQAALLAAAR